ncbi:MAG: carbohydrate kinase family protein [Dissulfurimicrobium sp.]|uniref:carbohydrate kinase family protein n=1 Tax=Dissulfurimicrobium TaxID=1769732 RepID=UPI001EDAE1A1|nr:carbohydrate kinase family protein [Dissulfurimicrobium hydrothermale]UKL14518.1 carbohydrate kinase family protein [Dissulfurimicrobium hydrothermale]
MMTEKDFLGHGALNLDIIYEIDDLDALRNDGFALEPGHEITGSHEDAIRLLRRLDTCGRLITKSGGGSSANTICALARLGFKTGFLGAVGKDIAGEFILGSMSGVETSMVTRVGRSAICVVVLDTASRDRAMMVIPPDQEFTLTDWAPADCLKGTRCLHLSSVVTKRGLENQIRLVKALLPDQILSFDPGEIYALMGLERPIIEIFKRTDILFVTKTEAGLFTGKTGTEAANCLLPMLNHDPMLSKRRPFFTETRGPAIILKQGAMGASLHSRGLTAHVPTEPLKFEIIDNTGAGDAFNAGVLAGIFKNKDVTASLATGARLAAHSLSAFGRTWMDGLDGLII